MEDACKPIIFISKALWYCGYFAGIMWWVDWGISKHSRNLGNSETNHAGINYPAQPVSNHLQIFPDLVLTPRKEVLTLEHLCILSLLDCSYWIGKTPVVQLPSSAIFHCFHLLIHPPGETELMSCHQELS